MAKYVSSAFILVGIVIAAQVVEITYGLSCYECIYDRINRVKTRKDEDCLISSLAESNCEMIVTENDHNDNDKKITMLGNWTSIETFNFDIDVKPRPVCYLELSMLNGEIIQVIRSCRVSSHPSTCELLERKGNVQKAKIARCYCQENGCNFPANVEQLSMMYIMNRNGKTNSGIKYTSFIYQNTIAAMVYAMNAM
ncbi:hypothetical protein Ocin01_09591 [Orchesella cincta]|uniref:Protein sleepless n=1 Tax=Orchesella cincta TaxID=48709 RepID=A0A1D2MVX1_ORCCI|nr:hypothetical protein Ocin01_09591 [Orchesella cincta]